MHKAPAKWTTEERIILELNKDYLWELFMTVARESMKSQINSQTPASATKPIVELTIKLDESSVHDEDGSGYTLKDIGAMTTTHFFKVTTNLDTNKDVEASVKQFENLPMSCPESP